MNIIANKKSNIIADKVVNTNKKSKKFNIAANKKLNTKADKPIDTNKWLRELNNRVDKIKNLNINRIENWKNPILIY